MGFIFPLFLWAGVALVIPVLIHLFNLRKYKRVAFPDTRFLRHLQLSTKKQRKIRNWKLLISRLIFLSALILAFAQPYWKSNQHNKNENEIMVIYLDNSYSMSVSEGQQNLFEQAKIKAKQLIESSSIDARFLILDNDKITAPRPLSKDEAYKRIEESELTYKSTSLKTILNAIHSSKNNIEQTHFTVYLFTDLQNEPFIDKNYAYTIEENIDLNIFPLQHVKTSNLYIDTAYFTSPILDMKQSNDIVVEIKQSGVKEDISSALQLSVNNQVRAVSNISEKIDEVWRDTLSIQLNENGWQHIAIAIQDHPISFDDTFRIAVRVAPSLEVLVVTENGNSINPYLRTALHTYEGFNMQQTDAGSLNAENLSQYNLIIFQNINNLSANLQASIKKVLESGRNLLFFPGASVNTNHFNEAFKTIGDISLQKGDTTRQEVVTLQQAHPLLNDLFEKIPENVQLPVSFLRYPIQASIIAHQQSLMSFRDGKPFLAQYNLFEGQFFLCSSPLDDHYSNFTITHYFLPIIYKMALQSGGGNIYALQSGSSKPIWIPGQKATQRDVWKIIKNETEIIPSQKPSGSGLEIFIGNINSEPGFYSLKNPTVKDTFLVAINAPNKESNLEYVSKNELNKLFKDHDINWIDGNKIKRSGWNTHKSPFPLWKLCLILALTALIFETVLLFKKPVMAKAELK